MSQVKHNSYFMVGMAMGLWVSLALVPLEEEPGAVCAVAAAGPAPQALVDDYEPRREDKPLGSGGAPAPVGRAVQRPRYYSTELGMRGVDISTLYLLIRHYYLCLFNIKVPFGNTFS